MRSPECRPFSKSTSHPLEAGFTLVELLIALVILGVIATFTIPKVLQSQQSSQYKAIAKEAAGMISGAYQAYKQSNTPTAAFTPANLSPYLNYVKINSTTLIDYMPTSGTIDCTAGTGYCLTLHNGATLSLGTAENFAGTTNLNAVHACLDPDSKITGGPGDAGTAVCFLLYYNGFLTTRGTAQPNTCDNVWGCTINPNPTLDPSWFSWN